MGRHRVEIKKIENKAIRQVTFAKRRNGLLKKAYEISALCDIEVALLAFSPSGKPTIFGGKKRFDQILAHYINLPQHQEGGLEDLESLQRLIDGMRRERNMYNHRKISGEMYVDAQLEEIHRDMNVVGNQIEEIVTQLKYYEDIPSYIRTVSEIEAYQEFLRQTMNQILMQKQALEGNHRAPQLGQNYLTAPLLEKLDVGVPSSTDILGTRGGQISQAPDGGLIINGGGPANYTSRARAVSSNAATAMGSNSIYNNNNNNINSINSNNTVLQTSMMNFVDSNGTFPTSRNQQGQYLNNNNNANNSLGRPPAPSNIDQGNEVRNYYFELARRLGLALPGFMTNNIIGNGNPAIGAQQINPPPGRGGPVGGAGPSGQASFQATRDPRG